MIVIGPTQFRKAAQLMAVAVYAKHKANPDGAILLTRAQLELAIFAAVSVATGAALKTVKVAEESRQDLAFQVGAFNDETKEPPAEAVAQAERNGGYAEIGLDAADNVVPLRKPTLH